MGFLSKFTHQAPAEPDVCGGKRYSNTEMRPIKNIDGRLCELDYQDINNNFSFSISIHNHMVIGLFSDTFNGSYRAEKEIDRDELKQIDAMIKESGINSLNGWCVEVNGLPPTTDAHALANYTSGEHLYFSFNGGNMPPNYSEIKQRIFSFFEKFFEYDPSKLVKPAPVVSPFLGEHKFTYTDIRNHKQTYTINVVNLSGDDNVIISSEGHFGNFILKARGSTLYNGSIHKTFTITMVEDNEGKPDKKYARGDLLGHLVYKNNSDLYLKLFRLATKYTESGTEVPVNQ